MTKSQVGITLTRTTSMFKKKPPLGSGQRFSNLETKLAQQRGVTNPFALAATIGRRNFGKAKFQMLSMKGRKKK